MKYIGVCTPAWSIPGGRKAVDWRDLGESSVPGPGNYKKDPSDKLVFNNAPKWKIGTAERGMGKQKTNKVPGPGSYNYHIRKSKSTTIIRKNGEKPPFVTKEKRFKRSKRDITVGPGSYNHKKLTRSAPKFSFGYKFDALENVPDAEMKKNIGPGLYEPQYKHREFSKGKTIPTTGRKKKKVFNKAYVPGPGDYNPTKKSMRRSYTSTKGTFGSSFGDKVKERFKKRKTDGPGVGSYHL